MSLLYFLESIRNPVLDTFFSFITKFGEETVFMVAALIIFWCINKYHGYYILSIGFMGTVINQFLKITYRIPRPWVKDPSFTIVESARAEATGYSFPSGHTQSSVSTFGGIAKTSKLSWLKVLSIILSVLVPISRMYLGVHTPQDVLVSVIVALVLIFGFHPIIKKSENDHKYMWWLICVMLIISIANLLYVTKYNFPTDVDINNLQSAVKNAYKLFGAILGIVVVYYFDSKYIDFKTEAPLLGQIFKVVFGLIVILAIKEGLKPVFNALGIEHPIIVQSFRYFMLVVVAGNLWPLTFKYFSKTSKK